MNAPASVCATASLCFPFPPPRATAHPLSHATAVLDIKGVSDAKLEKILESCKRLKACGFVTGTEALVQSKLRLHITRCAAARLGAEA